MKDTYKIIHYENMPMQYTEIFKVVKNEAVLTSTYNLCFGAKIRKIGIPLQTPVLLYEPHREKTGFLPRRKQRRRSASR